MPANIVIFGCAVLRDGTPSTTLRRRVEAAQAFACPHDDAYFIPTGGVGRHGPSEASVMTRVLRELGIPQNRILPEETGTDTLSSVRAVARMLRGHTAPVYVASSGFHQPRCVMLLRLAGFDARFTPPPPASANPAMRWYWRLRELPAILYDFVVMIGLRMLRRL